MAATHAKIRKNHKMISINFQKIPGKQIVIIQDMIINTAKEASNQNGRVCLFSEFAINFKK